MILAFRTAVAYGSITTAAAFAAPTLILHHGKIVTVDRNFSIAEAIAIEGERIIAVGKNEDVLGLQAPDSQIIDLAGKTLLPGLMDSHIHAAAAMTEFGHEIPSMESIEDVLQYVRMRVNASKPGEWIAVRQVFITRLKEMRYPTREELDRVAPENPVVFSTGPDAMLNSLALEQSGIDRSFKVPDGEPGKVEVDSITGEPTGLLRGLGGFVKVKLDDKKPTAEDVYHRKLQLFRDYNAVGLTTVADRNSSKSAVQVYEGLRERGELTVRMRVSMGLATAGSWSAIEKAIDDVIRSPLRKPDPMLQIIGTKVFLDGGMLTGSALMIEPWGASRAYGISDADYRGELKIPLDRLKRMVTRVARAGLQFTAHAVGDGAVKTLIDTYERVNDKVSIRDSRSCVTHCNFMTAESIAKAARLGVCIDLQPVWLYMDGRTLTRHFGDERMKRFQPLRDCFDQGVVVGGGSDHMQKIGSFRSVNPYNPWLGMQTAITRKARDMSEPVHIENAISREEAIKLYTINNAYLLFLEQDCGSLERGKLADMILLDRDPLTCPIEDLSQTKVLKTWLGGNQVHAAK